MARQASSEAPRLISFFLLGSVVDRLCFVLPHAVANKDVYCLDELITLLRGIL